MVLVAYRHGLRVSAGRPSLGPDRTPETATLHARRVARKALPARIPSSPRTSCGRPPVVSLRRAPFMPATQQRTTIRRQTPVFQFPHLLLGLARDRRRRRVLDLQPAVDAAGAVGRAEALRQDTIAAERAGVFVDDRHRRHCSAHRRRCWPVGRRSSFASDGLALLNRRPAHVLAVGLELWGSGIAIEVGGNLLIGLRCAVILGQPAVFIAPAQSFWDHSIRRVGYGLSRYSRRVADARFGRDDEQFAAGFDGFPDPVVECYLGSC